MKYNIVINQYELSDNKDITIQDASVIDWLFNMFGSDSDRITKQRKDGWTWISLPHLIEDMPLLRIKSNSGASKLIKRIKKLGYIETKTDRIERKLYARATEKLKSLYFSKSYKTRHQVPEEEAQVLEDTNHNTNISILNINSTAIAEAPFNLEEELVKLETSYWKPNKILALYLRFAKLRFQNKKQFDAEIAKNKRGAIALEGYNSTQLQATMEYCEKNYSDVGWNLYTVNKRVALIINGKI